MQKTRSERLEMHFNQTQITNTPLFDKGNNGRKLLACDAWKVCQTAFAAFPELKYCRHCKPDSQHWYCWDGNLKTFMLSLRDLCSHFSVCSLVFGWAVNQRKGCFNFSMFIWQKYYLSLSPLGFYSSGLVLLFCVKTSCIYWSCYYYSWEVLQVLACQKATPC